MDYVYKKLCTIPVSCWTWTATLYEEVWSTLTMIIKSFIYAQPSWPFCCDWKSLKISVSIQTYFLRNKSSIAPVPFPGHWATYWENTCELWENFLKEEMPLIKHKLICKNPHTLKGGNITLLMSGQKIKKTWMLFCTDKWCDRREAFQRREFLGLNPAPGKREFMIYNRL